MYRPVGEAMDAQAPPDRRTGPPGPSSMYLDLMMAAASVRSEQENIRWHERFVGAAPTAQEAVRRWRILIGIELSLLAKHVAKGEHPAPNEISETELQERENELLACTIGHVEIIGTPNANRLQFTVAVKEGIATNGASGTGVKVADIKNQGYAEHSPGLEPLVRETRENIANAMECRFIALHQRLRRWLFRVGELTEEFGHRDPRQVEHEARQRRVAGERL